MQHAYPTHLTVCFFVSSRLVSSTISSITAAATAQHVKLRHTHTHTTCVKPNCLYAAIRGWARWGGGGEGAGPVDPVVVWAHACSNCWKWKGKERSRGGKKRSSSVAPSLGLALVALSQLFWLDFTFILFNALLLFINLLINSRVVHIFWSANISTTVCIAMRAANLRLSPSHQVTNHFRLFFLSFKTKSMFELFALLWLPLAVGAFDVSKRHLTWLSCCTSSFWPRVYLAKREGYKATHNSIATWFSRWLKRTTWWLLAILKSIYLFLL